MELNTFSWTAFIKTGDIDAYLLYKTITKLSEVHDGEWQTLQQEGLLLNNPITERATECSQFLQRTTA